MNKKIDLHTHTTCSDGKQSPLQLLLKSINVGLEIVSISDHNSISAYKLLETQIEKYINTLKKANNQTQLQCFLKSLKNIKLVKGAELMVSYNGSIIEILAYDFDLNTMEQNINNINKNLQPSSEVLYKGLCKIILENNLHFDKSIMKNKNISLACFYKELTKHKENKYLLEYIENGQSKTADTFKKFILHHLYNPNSLFFVDLSNTKPTLEDGINAINNAGGIAFLAHPGRYSLNLEKEIDNIIKLGIKGLEVWHPDNTLDISEFLLNKVKEYKIKASGGSDNHQDFLDDIKYKLGIVNIPSIPETEWISTSQNFLLESNVISPYIKTD